MCCWAVTITTFPLLSELALRSYQARTCVSISGADKRSDSLKVVRYFEHPRSIQKRGRASSLRGNHLPVRLSAVYHRASGGQENTALVWRLLGGLGYLPGFLSGCLATRLLVCTAVGTSSKRFYPVHCSHRAIAWVVPVSPRRAWRTMDLELILRTSMVHPGHADFHGGSHPTSFDSHKPSLPTLVGPGRSKDTPSPL